MTEEWRPIAGYEGLYEVSDLGNVKNVLRHSRVAVYMQGRYPAVTLHKAGGRRSHRVHVLTLEAFVGPRPADRVGAHLDGQPTNGRLDNLAWTTAAENERHKVAHGTDQRGSKSSQSRFTDMQVAIIREAHGLGLSTHKLGALTGVNATTIHSIVKGESYSPKGNSAVGEAETPQPLPHPQAPNTLSEVEEARALLEKEKRAYNGNPSEIVKYLRWRADLVGDEPETRLDLLSRADRIEKALATLRASQEQDSEVRDV